MSSLDIQNTIKQQATKKVALLKTKIAMCNAFILDLTRLQEMLDNAEDMSSGEYLIKSNNCMTKMKWIQGKLKLKQEALVLQLYMKKHGHKPFTFEGSIYR
jgi:hypothetical protein